MATARQRAEWQRVGAAVAWVVNRSGFATQAIHPNEVIPEPYRTPEPPAVTEKSEEQKALESRLAWRALNAEWGKAGRN
jgi:hypothetical protein